MKKTKKSIRNLATGFLALTMLFGNVQLPVTAEDAAPSPSAQADESGAGETPVPAASAAPEASETPLAASTPEEPVPAATAEAETPKPETPTAEPAENAEPSASAEAAATPTASAEPTALPTAEAAAEAVASAEPSAEATAESTAESTEEAPLQVYKAEDAADMAAAVATLPDDADKRLTVTTDEELSDIVTAGGRAVYYDGTYIISVDDSSELSKTADEIRSADAEASPIEDEEMAVCGNGDEDQPTEITEAISEDNRNSAEEGLKVRDESAPAERVIAVIDTGANEGADVTVNVTDDDMADGNGHGTKMVKQIREAAGDTPIKIISIKAFGNDGRASISNVYAAVKYAVDAKADYINISAAVKDSEKSLALKQAITEAIANGTIVMAAAGNAGQDAKNYVPANVPGVWTIGAANEDGSLANISNYGDCVEYYVAANTTSDAAAKMTGYFVSGNFAGSGNIYYGLKHTEGGSDFYAGYTEDMLKIAESFVVNKTGRVGDGPYSADTLAGGGMTLICISHDPAFVDGMMYSVTGTITGEKAVVINWGLSGGDAAYVSAERYLWGYPGGYNASYDDGIVARAMAWAQSQVGGPPQEFKPEFSPSYASYTPGDPVTFTDTTGALGSKGYYVSDTSIGGTNYGDASADSVHASVSGNKLIVTVDENAAEVPEEITVTVDTDEPDVPPSFSASASELTSPGHQTLAAAGSISGSPGITYKPASVTLKLGVHGGYELYKIDRQRQNQPGQGDAHLGGAVFTIYNRRTGRAVATITTDDTGHAQTANASALKWGDYEVKETTAPAGYFPNTSWTDSFDLRANQKVYSAPQNKVNDSVWHGGIKVIKHDEDFFDQQPQGNATLAGTVYDIYNISDYSIFYNGKEISNTGTETAKLDGRKVTYGASSYVLSLTTDEKGEAETANDVLAYGTYLVVEKKAPKGYLNKSGVLMQIVEVHENGKIFTADKLSDPVQRGQLIVGKIDQERWDSITGEKTGKALSPDQPDTAQGDAALAGAEFTIYLKSANHVMVYDTATPSNNRKEIKTGEAVMTITTDAKGIAKTDRNSLPYGSYYVIETRAPKGYNINNEWRQDFDITEDGQVVDYTKDASGKTSYEQRCADIVIRGGIELTKMDTDRWIARQDKPNTRQGDADLSGAEYSIYNVSKEDALVLNAFVQPDSDARDRAAAKAADKANLVTVLRTDATGYASTTADALPYGTYLVKETKTPKGYVLNDWWYSIIEVREEGHVYNAADDNVKIADQPYAGAAVDDVIRGGVKFQKIDTERSAAAAQGDATLAGAEITIYNISEMDVYGASVQEASKAPQYDGKVSADGNKSRFHFVNSGSTVDVSAGEQDVDTLHYLYTDAGIPSVVADNVQKGLSTTAGTYAYITNNSDDLKAYYNTAYDDRLQVSSTQASKAEPRNFSGAQPVVTIRTDANGIAALGADALPYGTYFAIETKPSRGYNLNTKWIITFSIREDGVVLDFTDNNSEEKGKNPYDGSGLYSADREHQLREQVIRGDVRIYKEDLELSELNGVNRDSYNAKNGAGKDSTYNDAEDNHYGGSTVPVNPAETNGNGYRLHAEDSHTADELKYDSDAVNASQAIGGYDHSAETASLNGIEFTITNVSKLSVLSDAEELAEYQPGEFVTKIYTYYNSEIDTDGDGVADAAGYIAETEGKALPYGTYTIQETATNNSYMLTDGTPRTFEIEYDGEVADTTQQTHLAKDRGEDLIFRNQIRRGDFEFVKQDAYSNTGMQTLWVLENATSNERHVLVTDENGNYSSFEYSHSDNTNASDALLDTIGENYETEVNLKQLLADGTVKPGGIWFGLGEDGSMSMPHDRLGSLPYGRYILHEVRTETNEGADLQNVKFFVSKNSTVNNQGVIQKDSAVDLGTIKDYRITLETTAVDKESHTHTMKPGESSVIVDHIRYSGVNDFGTYHLKTWLVDYSTGEAVLDKDSKEIAMERDVELKKMSGTLSAELTFDSTNLGGRRLVVFEELTKDGVRAASHQDVLDTDQTVSVVGIRTKFANTTAGTKNPAEGKIYLTDNVSYTGLKVGKKYTLTGTIMDKATGEPLKDTEGEPVTATQDFTARTANGTVRMTFTVDASLITGKTVVAFETLEQGGIEIAIHADINDRDQTVTVTAPSIGTTASAEDGSKTIVAKEGTPVVIHDDVRYTSLEAGKEYTLVGVLHVRNTDGTDGGEFKTADGKPFTQIVSFRPAEADGVQKVTFIIDSSLVPKDNTTFVVFETLHSGNYKTPEEAEKNETSKVAEHSDIHDEGQTVNVTNYSSSKKMGTTARWADGTREAKAAGTVDLIDTVSYSGLTAGEEYTLAGTIHINDNGKDAGELKDANGKTITATVKFTPEAENGSVDVTFHAVDVSKLSGSTLVVFEKLFNADGTIELTHEDINDKGQTVTVVPPSAPTPTPGTTPTPTPGTTPTPTPYVPGGPDLHTTAYNAADGYDTVSPNQTVTVKDNVYYTGLNPGQQYTVYGVLHLKNPGGTDGGELYQHDRPVSTSVTFVPKSANGTVTLSFTFDASALNERQVVAFETLHQNDQLIAVHADITDDNQTIYINKDKRWRRRRIRWINTGSGKEGMIFGGIGLAAVMMLAATLYQRKKHTVE